MSDNRSSPIASAAITSRPSADLRRTPYISRRPDRARPSVISSA